MNFGFGIEQFPEAGRWVESHLALVIVAAAVMVLFGLAWWLLSLWIGARGKFIFLHDVVSNDAQIKKPWRQFRVLGNSLFAWRVVFYIAVLLAFMLVGGAAGALAVVFRRNTPAMVVAIICGVLILITVALLAGIIGVLLRDFIVPLMYRYGMRATAAWAYGLDLMKVHWRGFLLFLVVRMTVGMLVGIITATVVWLVILLTCCTAWIVMMIPVAGGVFSIALVLPAPVFLRLFSVYFLQQFHPDYRMTIPLDRTA